MRTEPTVDMLPPALNTLTQLMLAQAQECVWQKAAMDQLRDGIISRLALQISDYYNTALEMASNSSIQNVFPKNWLTHMQVKALHFNAAAQFRKSSECIVQDKYGEELSRLQMAADYVKRAFEIVKSHSTFTNNSARLSSVAVVNDLKSLQLIISNNLTRAEKDNDVIYLERIPLPSTLAPIAKISMVKALPSPEISDPMGLMMNTGIRNNPIPHPIIGLPLFQKLVPFAVHQAASVYVDRKERLIKEDIIAKLNELTAVYHSTVESLHLPTLIATVEQTTGLPESILRQAAEVRSGGGSQTLYDMWELVQKASNKNAEILEEAFNILDEEHEHDEKLRSLYDTRWTRPASHLLTRQLTIQGQKHRQTITSAQNADLIVRGKLDTWAKIIDVLTLTKDELEESIPTDDGDTPQEDNLLLIKRLSEEMDQHIKKRKEIIDQAKKASNADDISSVLLKKAAELTSKSPIMKIEAAQFEDLFIEELRKYDSYIRSVDEEDEIQGDLIRQITDAYYQHTAKTNEPSSCAKREKALQSLHQAYIKYKEIKTNLNEGLKV
ncbi:BRO1-like domain-containing protein [Pilobolus umbonatus]|nr:BRO1-like domain-containing protein [Pilobolus umbonatus]